LNRYGQIRDLLTNDLTSVIFIFGFTVTFLIILYLILSSKETENHTQDYYDRHGSLPK